MNHQNIENAIVDCLSNVGIEVGKEDDIQEYLQDSLVFVSFIVELEETFQIEFDDEFFEDEYFASVSSLAVIIEQFLNVQNSQSVD